MVLTLVCEHELLRVARPIHRKKEQTRSRADQTHQPRKPNLMERALELSGQNPQDFQDAMIPKGMKHLNFFSDEGLKAVCIPASNGRYCCSESGIVHYAMLCGTST